MATIEEIRRIKQEVENKLLGLPGVTGVDVGLKIVGGKKTSIHSIRVYVNQKKDVDKKDTIPKKIKGIPTDVIERRFELH